MTKKRWFQIGIGILLSLLIMKYFLEVKHIFKPIIIIISTIFIPLLLGGVLYYITEPIQSFLEKKGMPRWGSIVSIVALLLMVITILGFMIGNPIATQVNHLVKKAPTIAAELQKAVDYTIKNKDNLPPQADNLINYVTNSIQDIAIKTSTWTVSFISGTISVTLTLFLVPFFFIFMLKDHEKFAPSIYNVFKGKKRQWIKNTLSDMDDALRNYVQGQVLISLILATMIFIGYLTIGLEYALLLAILAFFMNMIPFIGPWLSLIPAIVVGFLQDPVMVIWILLITLVAQQLESNLITPNIMGKSLDIHPLTVITIVLAAGNIAGFIGIIIAIPTYAVLKVFVVNVYKERNEIKKEAMKDIE